jgi:hypothetical protein
VPAMDLVQSRKWHSGKVRIFFRGIFEVSNHFIATFGDFSLTLNLNR